MRWFKKARSGITKANARDGGLQAIAAHRKKVEMLFTHMKRILKLDRLGLRSLVGAQDEFLARGHRTERATDGDMVERAKDATGNDVEYLFVFDRTGW